MEMFLLWMDCEDDGGLRCAAAANLLHVWRPASRTPSYCCIAIKYLGNKLLCSSTSLNSNNVAGVPQLRRGELPPFILLEQRNQDRRRGPMRTVASPSSTPARSPPSCCRWTPGRSLPSHVAQQAIDYLPWKTRTSLCSVLLHRHHNVL